MSKARSERGIGGDGLADKPLELFVVPPKHTTSPPLADGESAHSISLTAISGYDSTEDVSHLRIEVRDIQSAKLLIVHGSILCIDARAWILS